MHGVCHGSRLVLGLENLAKVVLGKDHGVLLIDSVQRGIAHIEQISSERQVRAMFLQNAKRQQACTLRLLDGAAEVRGSQFFPMGRELGLRPQRRAGWGQTYRWSTPITTLSRKVSNYSRLSSRAQMPTQMASYLSRSAALLFLR